MFKFINDAYSPGFIVGEHTKPSKLTKFEITSKQASGRWLGEHSFPKIIRVRAVVKPTIITNKNIQATLQYNGKVLAPENLYNSYLYSEHAGVQIDLLSLAEVEFAQDCEQQHTKNSDQLFTLPAKQVFKKDFFYQSSDVIENFETSEMLSYLWGFGGFYKPGCKLSDIEQILFSTAIHKTKDKATQIVLYRVSTWQSKGMEIGKKLKQGSLSKAFEKTISKDAFLSLADHINNGDVTCKLLLKGLNDQQTYKSFRYSTISSQNHTYEIYFKKMEQI